MSRAFSLDDHDVGGDGVEQGMDIPSLCVSVILSS